MNQLATSAWRPLHWVVIGALTLFHFATFVAKPVHVDDTIYLETVRGILADPLRPLCNPMLWEMELRPIYTFALNPPLYNYQQAALVAIFGWSIEVLHVLAAGYVFLAAVAVFALARRFTRWPLLALALTMTSPTLVPQTNLMLDVPGMALVCAAVAAWVRGIDSASRRWLALGASAAAAALLTKYNSIVVLPLLGWYALLHRRPRALLWLLVPVGALALWCLHNRLFFPNGTIHLFQAQGRFGVTREPLFGNLVKSLENWGASFVILPACVVAFCWRRRTAWEYLAAAAVTTFVALEAMLFLGTLGGPDSLFGGTVEPLAKAFGLPWAPMRGPVPIPVWVEYSAMIVNGTLLLLGGLAGLRRADGDRRWLLDSLFLVVWPLGMSAFNVLFAPHHAPRYSFPAFAALPLLLLRSCERCGLRAVPVSMGISVALQCVLGTLLAASDHAFASGMRAHAQQLAALPRRSDEPLAYLGRWGFHWYAQAAGGMRALAVSDPPPPVGGIVAVLVDTPTQEFPTWLRTVAATREPGVLETQHRNGDGPIERIRFRRRVPTCTVPHPWPLRTIGMTSRTLLYAPGGYHGYLPYSWDREPFLVMEVLQRIP